MCAPDWFVCSCTCDTVDAAVVAAVIHHLRRIVCVKLTTPMAEFRWAFRKVAIETGSQNTLAIPLNTLATSLNTLATTLGVCVQSALGGLKPTPNH